MQLNLRINKHLNMSAPLQPDHHHNYFQASHARMLQACKHCWGSVTFWSDPDPTSDPTSDPTPLFRDFKDAIKINFSPYFFSYILPIGTFSSVLKKKFFVNIIFFKHYIRKGKDPEPDPDPYLWLMDPDPGDPKLCGSCGSGALALWYVPRFESQASTLR